MPGRLWYEALATPGDAPGPREAAVLSLLRTLPQLPSPSPPAAALTHSNPLLPFTFTQHPEGEELPPPFPSSAPGPAVSESDSPCSHPLCLAYGSWGRGKLGGHPSHPGPATGGGFGQVASAEATETAF